MEKKTTILPVLVLSLMSFLLLNGCKSEFEQIRTSGDVKNIYAKALEYYQAEEWQKSQTLLEMIIPNVRGTKEAEDVFFKYAYSFYNLQSYTSASYHFKTFANTYGASPLREEAEFMSAYAQYQESPTFRLDQGNTNQAIEEFEFFVNSYPDSKRVAECNKLIDQLRSKLETKAFEEGKLYFNLRYYQSAVSSFENLLKDFPETKNAEEVRLMILRSYYDLAVNSILDKREERFKECRRLSAEFLERYPKSVSLREVQSIQDNSNKQLKLLNNVRYQNQSAGSGS
ncbi:MAG TPA: outer membrane protein assembly factor BamD [Haliscomenobacter sp.]|mgnify:FL=1|uniref:outer membrane protein assembly factor BamD n=1 Tax=Haliscomenobacter sp. TaxID=2717303 RepID=UPI002B75D050|nr:outer membrane protein assembly factor BamD [Haliscomenobacter sp.]HOY15785.1 outer membrane protein assembly factor BamD [Haliscomenobacter sp.]HPH18683.1 outer membrane protein assembly factor BamD [Haliscomenobacter sp.]